MRRLIFRLLSLLFLLRLSIMNCMLSGAPCVALLILMSGLANANVLICISPLYIFRGEMCAVLWHGSGKAYAIVSDI